MISVVLLILFFFCSAFSALSADYSLPAENAGHWIVGTDCGVDGGIDKYLPGGKNQRTNLIDVTLSPYFADNTGVANAASAINSAITDGVNNDVIYLPAGTYKLNSQITIDRTRPALTLRGEDWETTTLVWNGALNGKVISIGYANFPTGGSGNQVVTGSVAKGVSKLMISNNTGFVAGEFGRLIIPNEEDTARIEAGAVPSWSYTRFADVRSQIRWITATDSTSVTIDPPLLEDYSNFTISIENGTLPTWLKNRTGVENLKIISSGLETNHYLYGVQIGRGRNCWVYKVHCDWSKDDNDGSLVMLYSSYKTEVRNCGGTIQTNASSDGCFRTLDSVSCALYDNLIDGQAGIGGAGAGWDVGFYSDGRTYNTVYAYNFFENSNKAFLMNHSHFHATHCLYEGNVGTRLQQDGYFGNASYLTLFRNWWSGTKTDMDAHPGGPWLSGFNRFSRNFALVGNVWGWDGTNAYAGGAGIVYYGYPNIGNFDFTGTAQPTASDWWADWGDYTNGAYSGGVGGFQEQDLDVSNSFTIVHNYRSANPGPGSVFASTADTLPASFAWSAKPSWFGGLSWPPIDPNAPSFDNESIPAGYRFVNGVDPPSLWWTMHDSATSGLRIEGP